MPRAAGDRVLPAEADLREAGLAAGLEVMGVTSAAPFVKVRETLEIRKAEGLHAGMAFTYRNPARSTDPRRALPGAAAIVVGARGYLHVDPALGAEAPAGRVARYAWVDHYAHLRAGLSAVADVLREQGWRTRVVADDNALVDRAAAHRAGIGWWGKNANVLLPGLGSWFVLGSVITDAPLDASPQPVADGCGTCTRCLDRCPTGAITAAGVVDARRCLSWLLQAEGQFPLEHRAALGDRIYGCDVCQDVCPPNRHAAQGPPVDHARPWAPLLELLDEDDEVVLRWAARWYIPRREVRYVRRNALVVLGNVADPDDPRVIEVLGRYLSHPDPLLRSHAVWVARRLGREDLLVALETDPDPLVAAELTASIASR